MSECRLQVLLHFPAKASETPGEGLSGLRLQPVAGLVAVPRLTHPRGAAVTPRWGGRGAGGQAAGRLRWLGFHPSSIRGALQGFFGRPETLTHGRRGEDTA